MINYLPALTCTSRDITRPTVFDATHRYIVLCISCLYAAAENGKSTSVPLRSTRLTPPTSPIDVPSTDSQSIDGCGLPDAEQSSQPPDEFENSNFAGGSITNDGPRK